MSLRKLFSIDWSFIWTVDDNSQSTLCVPTHLNDAVMNQHSVVINNAASKMAGGGGLILNNYEGLDVKDHLVDPDLQDFRPIEGGVLTQGDIIMGPYLPEVGEGFYWIPGFKNIF